MTAFETKPLNELVKYFSEKNFEERVKAFYDLFDEKDVLLTSSFGTNSAVLLHLIAKVRPSQKVYFINTGFHFSETLAYKEELIKLLKLKVEEVAPSHEVLAFSKKRKLWATDPDTCCLLNKILPLEPLKTHHKVWFSGLMAHQTNHRNRLRIFEQQSTIDKSIRFYPIIDMTEEHLYRYKQQHNLPSHPLEKLGYCSIGCSHCTAEGIGRNGRWINREKTECGLHVEPKEIFKRYPRN